MTDTTERRTGIPYEKHVVAAARLRMADGTLVWPWDCVPENELLLCGILDTLGDARLRRRSIREEGAHGFMDRGLDALARLPDGRFVGIQAKDRARLGGGCLGTFYEEIVNMRCKHSDGAWGEVWYSGRLDRGIPVRSMEQHLGIVFIHHPYVVPEVERPLAISPPLYPHQEEALAALAAWRGDADRTRGVLACPCRTGKTRVVAEHAAAAGYKHVVLFAPCLMHVTQAFDDVQEFLPDKSRFVVDCRHTRDAAAVRGAIASASNGVFVCATYLSADVVLAAFDGAWGEDVLVCVDEFHNLSPADLVGTSALGKVLRKAARLLCVSGTPRPFEGAGVVALGDIVYQYDLRQAIIDRRVCDYKIWVPSIHTAAGDQLAVAEDDVAGWNLRAMFVVHGMLRVGARRCIVYVPPGGFMDALESALMAYADVQAVEARVGRITCDTPEARRAQALEDFQSGSTDGVLRFLLSVRILDECVDVPECDSVYIVQPSKDAGVRSKVRAVQRLMRAATVRPDRPEKVAHCFVSDDGGLESLAGFLSAVRAADGLDFDSRIGAISAREYDGVSASATNDVVLEEELTIAELVRDYLVDVTERRFMSLADLCPAVAAQWCQEANGDVTPEQVAVSSNKPYTFQCAETCNCGGRHPHPTWVSTVNNRVKRLPCGLYVQKQGCPKCGGTSSEPLWCESLLNRCPEVAAQWCYELNGDLTPDKVKVGSDLQAYFTCGQLCRCGGNHPHPPYLATIGARVRRGPNGTWLAHGNCPHCRHRATKPLECESLAALCPEVAAQLHPDSGDAKDFYVNSNKLVKWRDGITSPPCRCGQHPREPHVWTASINSRVRRLENGTSMANGCPHCSSNYSQVAPCESVAAFHPMLLTEWHVSNTVKLEACKPGSGHKGTWMCANGHNWVERIDHRVNRIKRGTGTGCRACAANA